MVARILVLSVLVAIVTVAVMTFLGGYAIPGDVVVWKSAASRSLPLWNVVALAFGSGVLATGVIVWLLWPGGWLPGLLLGGVLLVALFAAAAFVHPPDAVRAVAPVAIALIVVVPLWLSRGWFAASATAIWDFLRGLWNQGWALIDGVLTSLAQWAGGMLLAQVAPVDPQGQGNAAPPPAASVPRPLVAFLIILLLGPALFGSMILVRTVLILVLATIGIGIGISAMTIVQRGQPVELRTRQGGLGGGQGGWRLSQPASLLLIAAVLLGAAVGLAGIADTSVTRPPPPPPAKSKSDAAPSAAGKTTATPEPAPTPPGEH